MSDLFPRCGECLHWRPSPSDDLRGVCVWGLVYRLPHWLAAPAFPVTKGTAVPCESWARNEPLQAG